MTWYGMVYDMIWYMICYMIYDVMYDMIYDMIWYGMIWYDIWYDILYDMIRYMIYMIWYMIWYIFFNMIYWACSTTPGSTTCLSSTIYNDFILSNWQSLLIQWTQRIPFCTSLWGLPCLPAMSPFAVLGVLFVHLFLRNEIVWGMYMIWYMIWYMI
jgi:hypothetical protein